MPFAQSSDGFQLYYETYGDGPALFPGLPASSIPIVMPKRRQQAYLDALASDYRVVCVDARGFGQTRKINRGEECTSRAGTVEQLTSDFLSIADHAGIDRFAYAGYSWGAASGLRIACQTDRISALMLGGWPALGGPWREMLEVVSRKGKLGWEPGQKRPRSAMAISIAYYNQVLDWNERDHLNRITCPRLNFMADNDMTQMPFGVAWFLGAKPVPLADLLRSHESELLANGWEIEWIPDEGHLAGGKPEIIAPILRGFLDRHRDRL